MSNKNSAFIHFHLYSLGVDTCARHAMKLGKEKKVTCNCIELLLIFFVCCIFFSGISLFGSSTFFLKSNSMFHRLLIVASWSFSHRQFFVFIVCWSWSWRFDFRFIVIVIKTWNLSPLPKLFLAETKKLSTSSKRPSYFTCKKQALSRKILKVWNFFS